MPVTLHSSGTKTATGSGTEDFLDSPNVAGEFQLQIDLSVMQANDVIELRAYKMVLAAGTQRVVYFMSFSGVQATDAAISVSEWIANTLTDTNAVRFSLKQTFGTGRAFPWAVLNRADFSQSTGSVYLNTGQILIKKNTALSNFMFVMRDSTGAPKTSLSVTATCNIDGAGFNACANAVTEIANGWYQINLANTDLNGTNIAFRMSATGASDTDFLVVTQP